MSTKKEIQTILIIVIGLLLFYFFFKIKTFLIIGISIGVISFIPFARKKIIFIWYKLSEILGFINTRILLGIIFFFILTPLALIRRLSTKDKLQLKKQKKGVATFYKKREHFYKKEDLENPW